MTTLPTVSEAGKEEASLHPSFTTHPAGETSHTNRQVWVTPQSTPTPEPLSISVYSTTLEMSNSEEALANSGLLIPQLPPSFQSPQENPLPTATSLTHSDVGYAYSTSNSQSVVTHTSISYPSVMCSIPIHTCCIHINSPTSKLKVPTRRVELRRTVPQEIKGVIIVYNSQQCTVQQSTTCTS